MLNPIIAISAAAAAAGVGGRGRSAVHRSRIVARVLQVAIVVVVVVVGCRNHFDDTIVVQAAWTIPSSGSRKSNNVRCCTFVPIRTGGHRMIARNERRRQPFARLSMAAAVTPTMPTTTVTTTPPIPSSKTVPSLSSEQRQFNEFVEFLIQQQTSIIHDIETTIERTSQKTFTRDTWGIFAHPQPPPQSYNDEAEKEDVNDSSTGSSSSSSSSSSNNTPESLLFNVTSSGTSSSGGITRVLQNGDAIEKGACSITVIRNAILSSERAASIRGRQSPPQQQSSSSNDDSDNNNDSQPQIQAGDIYSAVALSMVLHSRNPMVPTFRSDVRLFQVVTTTTTTDGSSSPILPRTITWLGGGADLTPYYLFRNDIQSFHRLYYNLCQQYNRHSYINYETMKRNCDSYFYLPARQEHRGTGGIFFDDIPVDDNDNNNNQSMVLEFGKEMTRLWMQSYFPIVLERNPIPYTVQEKYWQKLRRGRYLEFNLLYDRGVKFGLQTANARVEGVMVSAPPEIAYEYNYNSTDEREIELIEILKQPISWI